MKNLKNYGVQKLNTEEITQVNGGSWPARLILAALQLIAHDNEGYGRRMMASGSAGGAK